MSINYRILFPHDDALFAFIKFLEQKLEKLGFEMTISRQDPGSIDIYRYETKNGHSITFTRSSSEDDQEELKISSDWAEAKTIINSAADEFGKHIAKLIKNGHK